MKDLTHYFADLPRKAASASPPVKEVRAEPAKVDDAPTVQTATPPTAEEPRPKRKRGRVKIKITRDSTDGAVCNILESPSNLVDKTPSPCLKKGRKRKAVSKGANDDPSGSTPPLSNGQSLKLTNKQTKDCAKSGDNNQMDQPIHEKFADFFPNAEQKEAEKDKNDTKNKSGKKANKAKQVEKLVELAEKKGYSKRKVREEEEAAIIEERLEKRKKLFTEPSNNAETNVSDENSPKNETPTTKKSSLLNYFSKATPEQIEKERERINSKVVTKAEVHTPSNSPVPSEPSKKIKSSQKKKDKSNSKKSQEDVNEIVLIQSETVILSPKNEKTNSPQINNKPKWSMKIQLQANNTITLDDDDEVMYTPTAKLQKENIKNNGKIPKILLPTTNKKLNSDDSQTTNNTIKNKKEENDSSKVNLRKEKSKTDNGKIKTEINKKNSIDTSVKATKVSKINNKNLEKESVDDDCQIINESVQVDRKKEKLAPLFQRKIKPSADIVAARRLFLQSDIQENSNNSETQKPTPVGPLVLPFPKISHIHQLSSDDNSLEKAFNFTLKIKKETELSFDVTFMKTVSSLNNAKNTSEKFYECTKSDVKTVVSEVESYCSDASNLWKYISQLTKSAPVKKAPRTRRKSDKKNVKPTNDTQNELLNSPWTDKYKPKNSTEVVGNEEAVGKLKTWLESWKSSKNNEDYSSSEEFYNSDCSMASNLENNQVAVLMGPHGSGKTASVYAIAKELGYKVLEVNASSKRPGKKILKDFEEATKSHRVKKSDLKDMFIAVPKKSEESKKISQNSLILMEDIDLVFEEDEGFISAAFQLASNTKRPIVMTLTNYCVHLPKMAPNQLRITFEPITNKRATALLQLIALAETECKLSQNCIDILCQKGDLRRSLLQLQYLLLPGKNHISFNSLGLSKPTWSDVKNQIYKPAFKSDKSEKKKKGNKDKTNNDTLNSLANNLDNFCIIASLMDIDDPTSRLLDLKFESNMSLTENMRSYSNAENISTEIGNWLNDSMLKLNVNDSKKLNIQTGTNQLTTKKQIITGIDTALTQIASNTLDRFALSVDYLPNIRTICRAEEIRNQLNSKRGNRFYHYFQGSRLSNGMIKSGNILSAACRMLQETTVSAES